MYSVAPHKVQREVPHDLFNYFFMLDMQAESDGVKASENQVLKFRCFSVLLNIHDLKKQ